MKIKSICFVILFLVAGILIGSNHSVGIWVSIIPIVVAIGIYIIDFYKSRKDPFANLSGLKDGVALSLFLAVGIFVSVLSRPENTDFPKGEYYFSGTVLDYNPTTSGDKLLVRLSDLQPVSNSRVTDNYEVKNVNALITLTDATNLSYGSYISGTASLQPPETPANFLKDDYVAFLHNKGIYLVGFTEASKCDVYRPSSSFSSFWFNTRDRIEALIENSKLTKGCSDFLITILLGDKNYLDKEDRILFSDAGVAHIFAVSGLHVSLVGGFILGFLSLFFHGRLRRWKFILSVLFIWAYVLLVGAGPATCRAGIMITFAFMALFLQRKNNTFVALGWAVVLILIFSPQALYDIGFQLSVICVGSLILIAGPINFVDHRQHPRLFAFVSLITATLVATISSWMVCAFYFHKFSLLFLPLNLIALPLLPVFLIVALVYLLFSGFGAEIAPMRVIIDHSFTGFHNLAEYVTSLVPPVSNINPHVISVFLWLAGLCLAGYLLHNKKRKIYFLAPAALFLIAIVSVPVLSISGPNGFIIQKASGPVSVMFYKDGVESQQVLPEVAASLADYNNTKFLTLHSSDLTERTAQLIDEADYIILAKGCKRIPDELKQVKDKVLVTHPGIHWRYEREMISEAVEEKLKLHSLRYDGPLHVFKD